MPRMIKIGGKYINADRLYAIEPMPDTHTVRVTYEEAPGMVAIFNMSLLDEAGVGLSAEKVKEWAQNLALAIDPAYIFFNGEVGPATETKETRDH